MSATAIGHRCSVGQFLDDSLEGRQPVCHQISGIAGPEKSLSTTKKAGVVLVPAHSFACAKCFGHFRLVSVGGCDYLGKARHESSALFISKYHCLFRRKRITLAGPVIFDVTSCRHGSKPFPYITFCSFSCIGQFSGGNRTCFCHFAKESDPVTDDYERGGKRCAHVSYHLMDELLESCLIDCCDRHFKRPPLIACGNGLSDPRTIYLDCVVYGMFLK